MLDYNKSMRKEISVLLLAFLCLIVLPQTGHSQAKPIKRQPSALRRFQPTPPRLLQQRQQVILETGRSPVILKEQNITFTIGGPDGELKPLLGVNAGPAPSGEQDNSDVTAGYLDCGVNMVRTHDFYGPLDLSACYPDIKADPLSPGSYDFSASDKTFKTILDADIEPYMRLGDSYNNVRIPADEQQRGNLIRAGCEFIGHYQSGSEAGSGVRYVEIWNEPDNKQFWPAGFETFLPYFAGAFTALKQQFPGIKAGGPGFAAAAYKVPQGRRNVELFLSYLKEHNINPDFLSFHLYSNDPAEYYDSGVFYRQAAQNAGFSNCELHMTEWNTDTRNENKAFRTGEKAAAYLTAAWIAMQQAGIDKAFFYRGTDTNINQPLFYGMFYANGKEKPAAKAFKLWKQMSVCGSKHTVLTGITLLDSAPQVSGDLKPLWTLCGESSPGTLLLLISNIGTQTINYTLAAGDRPLPGVKVHELGADSEEIKTYTSDTPNLAIKSLTVQLIQIDLQTTAQNPG